MKSETLFKKGESYSTTEMQQPRVSGLEIGGSNPSNFRLWSVSVSAITSACHAEDGGFDSRTDRASIKRMDFSESKLKTKVEGSYHSAFELLS